MSAISSSIEETAAKKRIMALPILKKLAKEAPKACTVVLEKFQNTNQLFTEDEKGNRLFN